MGNWGTYASLAQLKSELAQAATDTVDDARLFRKLETASRAIDGASMGCGREFYVVTEVRYFTASRSDRLLIDDLLVLTELATDEDGDLDYDYVWTVGDYLLDPANGWPKTQIKAHPNGNYSFPTGERAVRVTGQWGYGDGKSATPYEDTGKTVPIGGFTAVATSLALTAGDGTSFGIGETLLMDSERLYITNISTDTLTVKRGINGTTAAAHLAAAAIYRYLYPDPVREACLLQASRLFRRGDAPFGVTGSAEFGSMRISALDPDVRALLGEFRKVTAA